MTSVTETIRPEDDPFIEHYQTPPVLEILCEEDGEFADSMDAFIKAIADNEALIAKESIRRYGGFYGPGIATFSLLLYMLIAHFDITEANGLSKIVDLSRFYIKFCYFTY